MYVEDWIERDVENNDNFEELSSLIGREIVSRNGRVMIFIYGGDDISISIDDKPLENMFTEVKDFGYSLERGITWISDRVVSFLNNVSTMEE